MLSYNGLNQALMEVAQLQATGLKEKRKAVKIGFVAIQIHLQILHLK